MFSSLPNDVICNVFQFCDYQTMKSITKIKGLKNVINEYVEHIITAIDGVETLTSRRTEIDSSETQYKVKLSKSWVSSALLTDENLVDKALEKANPSNASPHYHHQFAQIKMLEDLQQESRARITHKDFYDKEFNQMFNVEICKWEVEVLKGEKLDLSAIDNLCHGRELSHDHRFALWYLTLREKPAVLHKLLILYASETTMSSANLTEGGAIVFTLFETKQGEKYELRIEKFFTYKSL